MVDILSAKTGMGLPVISPSQGRHLLMDLLKGVSRTFYLSIRVLPGELRQPVGLAYLLARAADTITDTSLVPPAQRLKHLLSFRAQVKGPAQLEPVRLISQALTDQQAIPKERRLLTALPSVFSMLESSSEPDRELVRSVVVTLTQGMETDLTTFPAEDSGQMASFESPNQLDRYTYQVAGCVGEFWTAISMAHLGALKRWDEDRMRKIGVDFGKALQVTNVLRDVPKDLRIGRCYLPSSDLAALGMSPEALLDPSSGSAARPVLVAWIEKALEQYAAAEEYLLAIPARCVRLRLATLWPLLIGLATLARLARNASWLDPARPSRVSRRWIYRTLALSWGCVCSDRVLRIWIGRLRQEVEAAL